MKDRGSIQREGTVDTQAHVHKEEHANADTASGNPVENSKISVHLATQAAGELPTHTFYA